LGDSLLYLTSLGVTLSGVFAYYSVVESNVLRIPTLLFILNGHLISFLLRENKKKRFYSAFFLFSLLFLLLIDAFKGKGLLLFPPETGGEPGLIIGDFLLWLVVLRSYTLFSPGYLLFSIVPSIAFLGLISAYTVDPELFLYTSLCFLFSILLLIFNSYEIGRFPSLRSSLFTIGLFLFLLSVPLAFSLLLPLQRLTSALPMPQIYFPIEAFKRSDLYEGFPFISNAVLLGGGLPRGNEVILELKGEPTPLLRQGTYEYFSGRYWVKTLFTYSVIRGRQGVFPISPTKPRSSQIRQKLNLKETPLALLPPIGIFFGAFSSMPFTGIRLYLLTPPHPCKIIFQPNIAPRYISKGADNSLYAAFSIRMKRISYEVISQPDLPWQEQFSSSIYLQKPLSPKTAELAKSITSGLNDDYQKAIAIQEFLKKNYSYRLGGAPSPTENGVEWFLFKSKKGDCDFFASAMCILLREVGIPARVAVGYAVSEYDPKRDVWIVRQKDAHMWVEAYIKGKGWFTFDPTPPGGSLLYDFYLSLQRYYALHKREIFPLFLFLASLALLFLLFRATMLEERKKKKGDIRGKLVHSLYALGKKLEKMGLPPRKSSDTLREWLREISPFLSPSFGEAMREIVNICEEIFYGRDVEEKAIELALKKIDELRRAKRWQMINISTS